MRLRQAFYSAPPATPQRRRPFLFDHFDIDRRRNGLDGFRKAKGAKHEQHVSDQDENNDGRDDLHKHWATDHIPSWPADAEFAGLSDVVNGKIVLGDYAESKGVEFRFNTPMVKLSRTKAAQ